jgi:ABC-type lipoprotein export system ATPase subunit
MDLFKTLNDGGTTIVQVTHSETNAEYGDRIVELFDGMLRAPSNAADASSGAGGA